MMRMAMRKNIQLSRGEKQRLGKERRDARQTRRCRRGTSGRNLSIHLIISAIKSEAIFPAHQSVQGTGRGQETPDKVNYLSKNVTGNKSSQ